METTLDRGTVIKVPERQRNLYKIMSVDFSKRKYNVQGCSNAPGFPIKEGRGAGYYAVKFDHAGMEVFAKGTVEKSDRPTMLPKTEQKVKRVEDLKNSFFVPDCIKQTFEMLENALSPENLCCDGELPMRMVQAKRAKINRLWSALEDYIDQRVEPYV